MVGKVVAFCPRGPARVVSLFIPSRINLMAAELFSTVKAQRLISCLDSVARRGPSTYTALRGRACPLDAPFRFERFFGVFHGIIYIGESLVC